MRSFYITFVSDDVEKMRIFGALLDAGMSNFVITEDVSTVAENEQVEKICAHCKHDYNGHCVIADYERHSWNETCDKFEPRKGKRIDLIEE